MKIVINNCYGGFDLSDEAMIAYGARKGITIYVERKNSLLVTYWTIPPEERPKNCGLGTMSAHDFERTDPDLVAVIEELGDKANGCFASLEVIEIPDDVQWTIQDYDGIEWVAEKHRTWECCRRGDD